MTIDFKIWVDADACPRPVKDILFRTAKRLSVSVILVANQPLTIPRSPYIRQIQVTTGFDEADNYIASHAQSGDIVITSDIPLAHQLIESACHVINPRGELYDEHTIKERLQMRDFMETLRASGIETGGPNAYTQSDQTKFANQLDRLLTAKSKAVKNGG